MKPPLAAALSCLIGLALLCAVMAGCGGNRTAVRSTRAPDRHPEVTGEKDCATCHRPDLKASFKAWENSPHGLALVKCVVCHGSTGADFRKAPDSRGCVGCHAVQVEKLEQLAEEEDRPIKDCLACHSHHTLATNPHR